MSIAALIAITGGIAYSIGKNEGIRITRLHCEELGEPQDLIAQADTKLLHAKSPS